MKIINNITICALVVIVASFLGVSAGLAIENDECMECHSDTSLSRSKSEGMADKLYVDYKKFKYSVHNVNGVNCVDCHADITELNFDNEVPHGVSLASVNCDGCHEEEGKAYIDSVHKKAGGKGITIPCYACHDYHNVVHLDAESVLDRENRFCLKCHNPNKFHDWLPQKETHFDFVECTVCHAPEVPRHVNLRFFDLVTNKFLTGDEILQALNTDYAGFMPLVDENKDNVISVTEFENMILLLRQKNVRGTFHGELVVEMTPIVHHVNRGQASRECSLCHLPTSPFFRDVQFSLPREDGTIEANKLEREVLQTYYVNHFYALGGTRVRLLDKIGIAMVVAGVSVALGHLSVRIATRSQRRKKK